MDVFKRDENRVSPWGEAGPLVKNQTNEPRRWGWITAIVVVLILGGGVAYYFLRPAPGPNVGVEFLKPDQVLLGDPFTVTLSLSNYSDTVLKNGKISVFLPDGVYFIGQSQGQRVTEQTIGDLGPGSVNQQKFNLIVTSGSESIKKLTAKLAYATSLDSKVQYETGGEVDFVVSQPAMGLTITAPQSVYSGEDFDLKVSYVNNTSHDINGVKLKIDYPPSFQFERSTMNPKLNSGNVWDLGTVAAASNAAFTITGNMVGPGSSISNFVGIITASIQGNDYGVNSQTASVTVAPTPLNLTLTLNNNPNYVASLGDTLNYTLSYMNNFNVTLNNLNLKVTLISDLYDFSTLQTSGYFDSVADTVTWLTSNTPSLASLVPGQSGSVNFTIKVAKSFPIRLISDKNFTLKIRATAESPTVPPGTAAQKTVAVTNMETKAAGRIEVIAKAFWRDAPSGILNSGPYPPKVNQSTQYTVHWLVKNYATDVSSTQISAYLLSGSRFTGVEKSSIASQPSYDPSSGLITWTIPSLPATSGVVSPPTEAIFQIENTPSSNQVGQSVLLLSQTNIQAQDVFTGVTLQNSAPAQDTSLPYDTTIGPYNRMVQP